MSASKPPPPPPSDAPGGAGSNAGPDPREVTLERGATRPAKSEANAAKPAGAAKAARKAKSETPPAPLQTTAGFSDFVFGWTRSPKAGGFVLVGLGLLGLLLAALDFVMHRHAKFTLEAAYGFYALFGFLAFSFVVLMGWPLRHLLGRPEGYYDGGSSED